MKLQNIRTENDLKILEWKKQQALHKGSKIKMTLAFFLRALNWNIMLQGFKY